MLRNPLYTCCIRRKDRCSLGKIQLQKMSIGVNRVNGNRGVRLQLAKNRNSKILSLRHPASASLSNSAANSISRDCIAKDCPKLVLVPTPVHQTVQRCKNSSHTSQQNGTRAEHSSKTTHFGFTDVPEDQKEEKVYEVFKKCAETYDLMNDVMSAGVHRLWKDHFIRRLAPQPGTKLLDVAGGTGDIAFRFLNYANRQLEGDDTPAQVTVCDINEHMLRVGEERAVATGINRGITWLQGNAESLEIEDNTYDAYTIAFGIRNCTHVKKVLKEAYRVLKPGGRFMCLEFSKVRNSMLRMVYDQYSFQVIPVMGHIIAKDWNSYQYLVESIRKFPDQEEFASWIEEAGFKQVTVEDLTLGAVAIHSGFKIV